jgi:hypothetical protein
MGNERGAWETCVRTLGGVVMAGVLGGCAAAPDETVGATSSAVSSGGDALGEGATSTIAQVGDLVGVCSPLTCCFPTGAEWSGDPFENGLRALGCSTPQAYAEHYGESTWWMFTLCPASAQLTALVGAYANVAPYDSAFALNLCLTLDSVDQVLAGQVFVEFDPTCSSCRTVAAH